MYFIILYVTEVAQLQADATGVSQSQHVID